MYEVKLTILIVAGLYLIAGAFLLNTKNMLSALLFKLIPFALGAALLFVAAVESEMLHVGAPGATPLTSLELEPRRPRVACVARLKPTDIGVPLDTCMLARNEIAAFRSLIGVIGAEKIFEATYTPISTWRVS
jgi:hypothetical protein